MIVNSEMLKVNFSDGRTGQVEFDEYGDRVNPVYEIVNAQYQNQISLNFSKKTEKSANEFERPILVFVGRYGVRQV